VLKRFCPDLESIEFISQFSCLFEWDEAASQWCKLGEPLHLDSFSIIDVEGSLYILRLCQKPFFRLFLFNKKKADNFQDDLTPEKQFHKSGEHVGYRQTVEGITRRLLLTFNQVSDRDAFLEKVQQA